MTEEPPVRRRLLGGTLRRIREDLGLALEDAARTLECDRSKISRIETGDRGIRPKELRELLTDYGVPEDEQQVLASLTRRPARDGWWEEFQEVIPDAAVDHLILESGATEIMSYDPQLIPDLLQTPGYARAAAAGRPGILTDSQLDQATAALAARQQSVLSGSTQLSVVIGEAALRQEIGEPGVLAAQIGRLIDWPATIPAWRCRSLLSPSGRTLPCTAARSRSSGSRRASEWCTCPP